MESFESSSRRVVRLDVAPARRRSSVTSRRAMSRIAALRALALVACVATLVDRRCGVPSSSSASDATAFDESRARATARALEALGARPCGTPAEARGFATLERATTTMAEALARDAGAHGVASWTTAETRATSTCAARRESAFRRRR